MLWARAVGTWFAVRLDSSGKKDAVTALAAIVFMRGADPAWATGCLLLSENFSVEAFQAGSERRAVDARRRALRRRRLSPRGCMGGRGDPRPHHGRDTAVVGWRAWLAVLRPVMSGYAGEISADAQSAIDEGRHLIDESRRRGSAGSSVPRSRERPACAASTLFTRLGLGVRSASLAARTLRYWIVDTRLNMNMVLALLFPVIAIFMGRRGC